MVDGRLNTYESKCTLIFEKRKFSLPNITYTSITYTDQSPDVIISLGQFISLSSCSVNQRASKASLVSPTLINRTHILAPI